MTLNTFKAVFLGLLLVSSVNGTTQTRSAAERYQNLKEALRKARNQKHWRSSLAAAQAMEKFLNQSPDSLLEAARAEVHVGDLTAASRKLQEFVTMGEWSDLPNKSDEFAPLRERGSFSELEARMKANRSPISLATKIFSIHDADLLAEDVDYDANAQRFLITSVRKKKIVAITATGADQDFAKAPDNWSMLAIKVDARRRVVWATEVALQGFIFAPASDWGRSAVVCYDLGSGKLLRRIEGPRGSALGDMVLTAEGNVIVSDGNGGGVYRLMRNSEVLQRLDDGDFMSPQTPAMHPDGRHVFVPDYMRGIGVLEITTKHVRWLSMQGRFALSGIDGLYFEEGRLIAVQNGTSPERAVAFTLDRTLSRVIGEKIIERSTEHFGDPTHGVVVDGSFYYIANSGWDLLDDQGNVKPGLNPSEASLMDVQLGEL